MKNNHKKHRGFTLLEMVIGITLLAMLIIPAYSIIISTMDSNKQAKVKQFAALQGQEIFEKIQSEKIEPRIDEEGNITGISKIGTLVIPEGKNEATQTVDQIYKVTVKVVKNEDITLAKEITAGITTNDLKVDLSGTTASNSTSIQVKSDNNNDKDDGKLNIHNLDTTLKLVINTMTKGNQKIVVVKDSGNNDILTYPVTVTDENKSNQIKLVLNFDGYEVVSNTDSTKLKTVEVSVYNQDDNRLNLFLQKSTNLDVQVDTKLGDVRVYDNRSLNPSKLGELYNINITVTKEEDGKEIEIFSGKSSQNININ
ncbi:PulJ/GspJ family protein [Clostridium chromiireducens]|uniref:Prepilin-type N-terminal cleavage/methylation domain-containing protein n=1 Tax=Clostridium chromiireducens TaxID=225345 RepID=A0A1V4IKR0_9CLOT|nr:prepilin-type N-terminal cleavage/methylation domain-containing protein [Clostridium chromiireducens]OPJ60067.1 hypothetical protein CLCHR_31430 [Clostridium chromiireducens]